MGSTSQDIPNTALLAEFGEKLLGMVMDMCTFTLIYGLHFGF